MHNFSFKCQPMCLRGCKRAFCATPNRYWWHLLYAVVLFAIFIIPQTSAADTGYRFMHLTSRDGLPHQQVEALAQDRWGNIWIGTRNGLCRYDGYRITTYRHRVGDNTSIKHSYVHYIFVDSKGRIWVGTENGVSRYRPLSDDFRNYPHSRPFSFQMVENHKGTIFAGGDELFKYSEAIDSFIQVPVLDNGFVNSMAVDQHNNLYMSTTKSIFWYDSSLSKIHKLDPSYYADFISSLNVVIMPLKVDSRNRLWLGRNGKGVMYIDLKTGQKTIIPAEKISNGIVRTIEEDGMHRMWIGTEGGVTIIYPDGRIVQLRHEAKNGMSLSDNAIYKILCDKNQNIWIGSYFGGVDYLLSQTGGFHWIEPGLGTNELKSRVVRMIIEPQPGIFWLAMEDGGINVYDSRTGVVTRKTDIQGLGTNVHSLYYDRRKNEVWIGTRFNGLIRYSLSTGQQHRYYLTHGLDAEGIFYIAQQRNGRIWVATMRGLRYYDEANDRFLSVNDRTLRDEYCYTLYVDLNDNLWVGTTGSGIFCINGRTGRINHIRACQETGLKDHYIICIYQDVNGRMWFGTNNYGLQYLDAKTGRICEPAGEPLLANSTICSINEDWAHHLWISTSQGLFRYDIRSGNFIRYSSANGLPVNQFNFSSSLRAANGTMLFGTIDGLITFNARRLAASQQNCRVFFKTLSINDETINVKSPDSPLTTLLDSCQEIRLSYNQARNFSIEYGVIMPGRARAIEYQVWVEGIDETWRNVGNECIFHAYSLRPGTYKLHVRANSLSQSWDKCPERVLKIVVKPPFYQTVWAYLFYLLVLAYLARFLYRHMLQRQDERNAVKMARMEKEKLEEVDRVKFNFFTIVSHELKTPLSLIMAPLRSMQKEKLDPRVSRQLDMALRNARKMEQLIGELVTFNKIETDNFPFYIQKGDPLNFIEQGFMTFAEVAAEKKITFSINCENNGEEVWFSPSYVERIVNNLLSNALKFTPADGGITLSARIVGGDGSPYDYLEIKVADTGIGIVKEELSHIFDRYYQTKRGYNANNSGWGIGLSLVKRLVEVHKGDIQVDSEIGQGTTFTVRLNVSSSAFEDKCRITADKVIVPLTEYKFSDNLSLQTRSAGQTAMPRLAQNALRILIVDDNPDMLNYLTDYFKDKYNIVTAPDGCEALEIVQQQEIALVVSDVMMPNMDGIELCKRLKTNIATSHIPVILLTAKTEADDVMTGYAAGAEAYVSKPFDPQVLELQINNIVQLVKNRQHQLVNTPGVDAEADTLTGLDREFVRNINGIVEKNIANSDFSIADITSELGVSRSLLHTKMKSLMDISMGEFIRKKRLEKACELLKKGYNVSESAYRTGFSDPNYFSKAFKKQMGVSPSEYVETTR